MKNALENIQAGHFRYLKEEDIQTPLSFVKEFCSFETEVETFREEVHFLINAATTRKSDFNGKFYVNSEDYAYNLRQMISVVEVLWILHHHPILQFNISETHPLYQKPPQKRAGIDVQKRINNNVANFRKLEDREINDISIFLDEFFSYRNLNEWRELLDDLLTYAYTNDSIFDGTTLLYESVAIREYLEKMAEAVFLIADISFKHLESSDQTKTESEEKTNLATTVPLEETSSDHAQETLPLNDDNFTESLVAYLNKFWSHLEEESNYHYGAIMFSEELEKELLLYFETFDPTFLNRNFRRVYMGYLEHLFDTGTPYYHQELRIFTAHMDTFFELLDLAAEETAHWPQENRLGREED